MLLGSGGASGLTQPHPSRRSIPVAPILAELRATGMLRRDGCGCVTSAVQGRGVWRTRKRFHFGESRGCARLSAGCGVLGPGLADDYREIQGDTKVVRSCVSTRLRSYLSIRESTNSQNLCSKVAPTAEFGQIGGGVGQNQPLWDRPNIDRFGAKLAPNGPVFQPWPNSGPNAAS